MAENDMFLLDAGWRFCFHQTDHSIPLYRSAQTTDYAGQLSPGTTCLFPQGGSTAGGVSDVEIHVTPAPCAASAGHKLRRDSCPSPFSGHQDHLTGVGSICGRRDWCNTLQHACAVFQNRQYFAPRFLLSVWHGFPQIAMYRSHVAHFFSPQHRWRVVFVNY